MADKQARITRIEALKDILNSMPSPPILPVLSALICEQGFFEPDFYLAKYPDVKAACVDPAMHYLLYGWREARSAGSWCDQDELARLFAEKPEIAKRGFTEFLPEFHEWINKSSLQKTTEINQPTQPDLSLAQKFKIIRQGSIHALYNRQLHVDWTLTNMCNYKCSYCWGQEPLDKKKFNKLEHLKKAVDTLAALQRPSYKLTLSGGEPTTHPHFFQLIDYIAQKLEDRLNYILIISNGSRHGQLYQKLAALAQNININMLMSLHTEFVDVGHILELVPLITANIGVTFNLMFNPAKRDLAKTIAGKLIDLRARYPFGMNIALLRKPPKFDIIDGRYTDADHAWWHKALADFQKAVKAGPVGLSRRRFAETTFVEFEKSGKVEYMETPYVERDNLLKAGYFNFKGMHCMMGASAIAINPDGNVLGAQCKQARAKYNIFKENPFAHPDFIHAEICGLENCGCSANDSIPKFARKAEAENFLRVLI